MFFRCITSFFFRCISTIFIIHSPMIPKMSRMLGTQMTSRLTTKRRHNAIEMWRTQWKGLSGNRSWRRALRIWKHKMTKKLKLFKHLPCIQKLFTESFDIKGTLRPKMKINILFYHLLKLRPPQMYMSFILQMNTKIKIKKISVNIMQVYIGPSKLMQYFSSQLIHFETSLTVNHSFRPTDFTRRVHKVTLDASMTKLWFKHILFESADVALYQSADVALYQALMDQVYKRWLEVLDYSPKSWKC